MKKSVWTPAIIQALSSHGMSMYVQSHLTAALLVERDPKNAKQTEEPLGSANSAAREIKDKPDSTTEEPLLA